MAEWPARDSAMALVLGGAQLQDTRLPHRLPPAGSVAETNGRESGLTLTAFIRLIPLYCVLSPATFILGY